MNNHLRTKLVSKFICIAEACEDTCCKQWDMQVDSRTVCKYQNLAKDGNNELMESVLACDSGSYIMKKHEKNFLCVKFHNGRCEIQRKYGEDFLGDACSIYPRIVRNIGNLPLITATLSCPEIIRLAMTGSYDIFSFEHIVDSVTKDIRIPTEIRNVLPESITIEDAISIHSAFIAAAGDESFSCEKNFLRIASACGSLHLLHQKQWKDAAPVYLNLAAGRALPPEKNINDPFNLLHALCGLIVASQQSPSPSLLQIVANIEKSLCAKLDWANVAISTSEDSAAAYEKMQQQWNDDLKEHCDPYLKKWLAAQLSAAFFPFAGLGENITERITIIGFRLAILRISIISGYEINISDSKKPSEVDLVEVIKNLSRFLDHLASPLFLLQICAETGWNKEARMAGIFV